MKEIDLTKSDLRYSGRVGDPTGQLRGSITDLYTAVT